MNIFKVLRNLRDDIISWCSKNFARKLNKNLGSDKANKILITNEYGDVTAADVDATKMVTTDALNTAVETEATRAKAAEKKLSDAIATLTDGAGTDDIDTVKELIQYVNTHGTTTEQIQRDISANAQAIAKNAELIDANSTLISNYDNLWLNLHNDVEGLKNGVNNSDNTLGQMQAAISQNTSSIDLLQAKQASIRNQADTNATNIQTLSEQIANLTYVKIAINSFKIISADVTKKGTTTTISNSNGIDADFEKGSTVSNLKLSWNTSRIPKGTAINVGGTVSTLTPDSTTGTFTVKNGSYTTNSSFSLTVTADKPDGTTDTQRASASIYFYTPIYYGKSSSKEITNDLILGLEGYELRSSKLSEFSVTADDNEYIYYCQPTGSSYGTCTFKDKDTGLGCAFEEPVTIAFTNSSGHTENYYVYRSINDGLGNSNIQVL